MSILIGIVREDMGLLACDSRETFQRDGAALEYRDGVSKICRIADGWAGATGDLEFGRRGLELLVRLGTPDVHTACAAIMTLAARETESFFPTLFLRLRYGPTGLTLEQFDTDGRIIVRAPGGHVVSWPAPGGVPSALYRDFTQALDQAKDSEALTAIARATIRHAAAMTSLIGGKIFTGTLVPQFAEA